MLAPYCGAHLLLGIAETYCSWSNVCLYMATLNLITYRATLRYLK